MADSTVRELRAEIACEALSKAGFPVTPADVRIEAREERWIVHMPGERMAWFAVSDNARTRLGIERRLLLLLETRCRFAAPRVLAEDIESNFDVRLKVPGIYDPWLFYAEVRKSGDLAARLGTQIGTMLAAQHSRITAADVAGWLPTQPAWPESRHWVRERLGSVIDDAQVRADADTVMRMYEDTIVSESEKALVHTDVGFHNMGIDPQSHVVHGLFDYTEAAWADRHHDFRYLVFDFERPELLDAALSAYHARADQTIRRERVLLYNAACAVTFLAYRAGTPPEERSCGRTLSEDLRWSRYAIDRVLVDLRER